MRSHDLPGDDERSAALDARLDDLVAAAGRRDVPDQTADILVAITAEVPDTADRRQTNLRGLLALAGLVQVVIAIAALVDAGLGAHPARELAAWQLALGAGFALAAWQPVRAVGLLPILAVAVGFTLVAAIANALGGTSAPSLTDEWVHLVEVIGLVLVHRIGRPWASDTRAVPLAR